MSLQRRLVSGGAAPGPRAVMDDISNRASAPGMPATGNGNFAMAAFLARWGGQTKHDLSASESATWALSELLKMADPDDCHRWDELDFGYSSPYGAAWLREEIAGKYRGLDPANVVCCAGAQEGVTCVMRALLGPGDHAVVVVPIYQPSEQAVTSICAATGIALQAAENWQLDVNAVAAALRPETKLVLINFPNSPTGAGIDPAVLASLVALCRRRGLWLVNDEVYRAGQSAGVSPPPPVAEQYERGISIDAVSKRFGLPGLRVGWVACREASLIERVLLAKSALSSCLAKPSEVLAHIALKTEARIIRRNTAIANVNRQRLLALLHRHADLLEESASADTVLAFPRYRGADGADRFAHRLVREAGVLVLPSSLWHSPLAAVPSDRLRIGLGHIEAGPALAALDAFLTDDGGRVRAAR